MADVVANQVGALADVGFLFNDHTNAFFVRLLPSLLPRGRTVSPREIAQQKVTSLVEQARNLSGKVEDLHQFDQQVVAFFSPLIIGQLSPSEQANSLRPVVLIELSDLIINLLPDDSYFSLHYQTVVAELIDACRWKQSLRTLSLVDSTESNRGQFFRQTIRQWIEDQSKSTKSTRLQRLCSLLTDTDQPAVALGTLRALVAFLRKQDLADQQQTTLFWLRNGQIQLRLPLVSPYLLAQAEFRVFLFRNPQEADFIEEALQNVKYWLRHKALGQFDAVESELMKDIEDLVSKTGEKFLTQCQQVRMGSRVLNLDAQLSTYLISFVNKPSVLTKLFTGRQDEIKLDTTDSAAEAESTAEDEWEAYRIILRQCMLSITEQCRRLISARFGFGTDDQATIILRELATLFDLPEDTLESQYYRCMKKLKECLLEACNQQKLTILPR